MVDELFFLEVVEVLEVAFVLLVNIGMAVDDVEEAICQGVLAEDCLVWEVETDLSANCNLIDNLGVSHLNHPNVLDGIPELVDAELGLDLWIKELID